MDIVRRLWRDQEAQDIAEYAVMLAVILVIVIGTVRLIGSNANNVFSSVASSIQSSVRRNWGMNRKSLVRQGLSSPEW